MTRTDAHSDFNSLSAFATPTSAGRPTWARSATLTQAVERRSVRHRLMGAVDLLLGWSERVRQRRQLLQFDDHLLHDIGITRAEAIAEAAKPFWRA